MEKEILTINRSRDEVFLHARTLPFVFLGKGKLRVGDVALSVKDLTALIARMKRIMRLANGVGLSANQIGLNYQLFVAAVHTPQGEPKFYAILNPTIEKTTGGTVTLEEGCLSIPDTYGDVPRARHVTLKGFDKNGRAVKIRAWDLLARVFQHEVDHLNGKLFSDRTKLLRRMSTA